MVCRNSGGEITMSGPGVTWSGPHGSPCMSGPGVTMNGPGGHHE